MNKNTSNLRPITIIIYLSIALIILIPISGIASGYEWTWSLSDPNPGEQVMSGEPYTYRVQVSPSVEEVRMKYMDVDADWWTLTEDAYIPGLWSASHTTTTSNTNEDLYIMLCGTINNSSHTEHHIETTLFKQPTPTTTATTAVTTSTNPTPYVSPTAQVGEYLEMTWDPLNDWKNDHVRIELSHMLYNGLIYWEITGADGEIAGGNTGEFIINSDDRNLVPYINIDFRTYMNDMPNGQYDFFAECYYLIEYLGPRFESTGNGGDNSGSTPGHSEVSGSRFFGVSSTTVPTTITTTSNTTTAPPPPPSDDSGAIGIILIILACIGGIVFMLWYLDKLPKKRQGVSGETYRRTTGNGEIGRQARERY